MKTRRYWALTALVGTAMALPAVLMAQVPDNIDPQLRAIGRKVDTIATSKIYTPLQTKAPYAGVRVERDIKFGAHEKQGLDVFAPSKPGKGPLPVLVMVHGGGFVAGDKNIDETGKPSAFYDNIMLWAVKNGMVGVNINYRLAPEFQYPAVQQDIGAAIGWVQQNIQRYGGDPSRIDLMGHSAGAAHVASYVAHPEYGPDGKSGIRRAVFSSGSYDFASPEGRPHSYFGANSGDKSSIPGLVATKTPYMIIVAERDPVPFHLQMGKLVEAVCATGSCPPVLLLKDHGHMSGVYSINSPDQSLSGPILTFLKGREPASAGGGQ
jgi:triacylglycerol lipase